jgi:prepilin-type N-terminal cleavage/methylation domain-containing protein
MMKNAMIRKQAANKAGFTLVEILGVMTIIVILLSLVLGIAGAVSRKADAAKCRADIELIKFAMEEYLAENGSLPTSLGYLPEDTPSKDPWNRAFVYTRVVDSPFAYELGSYGPDGKRGKANTPGFGDFGQGDDVTNRNLGL